jgi:hypothetical protein
MVAPVRLASWRPIGRTTGRRPGAVDRCPGDARADMALARADMLARNQLKLNSFLTLVYQAPAPAISPQVRHGRRPPLG